MGTTLDTIWTRRSKIAERRMSICNQCEFLKRFNRCDKCGCFMDAKTHFMDSECPINKWSQETINMNEEFDFGEIQMEELVNKLKECLADTFVLYMKVHGYHWNVIGPDFPQYHEFFADLYEELHGATDDIAEQIRQLDSFAPGSLSRMIELSSIEEADAIPVASKMFTNLIADNETVLECLVECYEMAETQKEYGLSNFVQDRITAHKKHHWMIKATAGMKS